MKKLYLLLCVLIPILARAQTVPAIDTAHYLIKPNPTVMRTDTLATNLLTYNQTTHQADLMSGVTLTNYFRMGLQATAWGINILSKSANYTILSTDFSTSKWPVILLKVDCTSGGCTQTLPTTGLIVGQVITIVKTDATANTITIANLSYDNVIGTKNWAKELIWDGSNWIQN